MSRRFGFTRKTPLGTATAVPFPSFEFVTQTDNGDGTHDLSANTSLTTEPTMKLEANVSSNFFLGNGFKDMVFDSSGNSNTVSYATFTDRLSLEYNITDSNSSTTYATSNTFTNGNINLFDLDPVSGSATNEGLLTITTKLPENANIHYDITSSTGTVKPSYGTTRTDANGNAQLEAYVISESANFTVDFNYIDQGNVFIANTQNLQYDHSAANTFYSIYDYADVTETSINTGSLPFTQYTSGSADPKFVELQSFDIIANGACLDQTGNVWFCGEDSAEGGPYKFVPATSGSVATGLYASNTGFASSISNRAARFATLVCDKKGRINMIPALPEEPGLTGTLSANVVCQYTPDQSSPPGSPGITTGGNIIPHYGVTGTLVNSLLVASWQKGGLALNGNIYCAPFQSNAILKINPDNLSTPEYITPVGSDTFETQDAGGNVIGSYMEMTTMPDGNMYALGYESDDMIKFDATTETYTLYSNVISSSHKVDCIAPFNDTYFYGFAHTGTGPTHTDVYVYRVNMSNAAVDTYTVNLLGGTSQNARPADARAVFQGNSTTDVPNGFTVTLQNGEIHFISISGLFVPPSGTTIRYSPSGRTGFDFVTDASILTNQGSAVYVGDTKYTGNGETQASDVAYAIDLFSSAFADDYWSQSAYYSK